jgi:drug/metabolite transporter (DMT)-like permease
METKGYFDLEAVVILIIVGLVLAFTGIFVVFGRRLMRAKVEMFYGDIVQVSVGVLWGATTLYIFFHEELTGSLIIGLPLVSAGIFMVNWRRRAALLT